MPALFRSFQSVSLKVRSNSLSRGSWLDALKSGTAMRILSTPSPVPVLIQSWAPDGMAIIRTHAVRNAAAILLIRNAGFKCVSCFRFFEYSAFFAVKSCLNLGIASPRKPIACNRTNIPPKRDCPNNLTVAVRMYRSVARRELQTYLTMAHCLTAQPECATAARYDRYRMLCRPD